MRGSRSIRLHAGAVGLFAGSLMLSAFAIAGPAGSASTSGSDCLRAIGSGSAAGARDRAFTAAARTYAVPKDLLVAVSYMESRWDNHGSSPSTSGGYGPLHLTDVTGDGSSNAKGDGATIRTQAPASLHTLQLASRLTGLNRGRLVSDPAANICGGAAVLASYQRDHHGTLGASSPVSAWTGSVGAYSGTAGRESDVFVSQVYRVLTSGAQRTTNDGQQMRLAAHPSAAPLATPSTAATVAPDCPPSLGCEWIPAPYKWYGKPDPGAYGNHDLANRPKNLGIDYIVIHDTEATYDTTIGLVQDPTYVSWHYTIRSNDGHVAEHVRPKNVAWHAGNWYVNMHSIGIEHEGFAADGSTWYTESMYESSATLVRYLTHRFHIPVNRSHIIGHDQVPGITPAYVAGMHWDPGPFWDWQHYFDLLGKPIGGHRHAVRRDVGTFTVVPGFQGNIQPVTGCDASGSGNPCPAQPTNFVYVHTAPDAASPLVTDIGLHPDGSPSTTDVSDIGARLAAGQQVVTTGRSGDWVSLWYLGQPGWVYSPRSHPVLVPARVHTVTVKRGLASAPVYGRAYPEKSAYPKQVPYQTVTPLQYSILDGQSYVLADRHVPTDYYYATTFTDGPYQRTDIRGHDRYYEIYFGHRVAFVRAANVRIH